jgi:hypothetical protein
MEKKIARKTIASFIIWLSRILCCLEWLNVRRRSLAGKSGSREKNHESDCEHKHNIDEYVDGGG